MTLEEMIMHLRAFDRTLDKVYSVSIYGGSAMMLHGLRDSSLDIDMFSNSPFAYELEVKAQDYAKRNGLREDWLNMAISVIIIIEDLVRSDMEDIDFDLTNIKVRIPSKEQLLAMKIFAARKKDLPDIIKLVDSLKIVSSEVELSRIVKKYFGIEGVRTRNRKSGNAVNNVISEVVSYYDK